MTGKIRGRAAISDKGHSTLIVLVQDGGRAIIALSSEKPVDMNGTVAESDSATSSASVLDLVTILCLADLKYQGPLSSIVIVHSVWDLPSMCTP
jgi:hypothetical protein